MRTAAARLLDDPDVWPRMLPMRNLPSHTYDAEVVAAGLRSIRDDFLAPIDTLHGSLTSRLP